jgi:diguanylate cyclase
MSDAWLLGRARELIASVQRNDRSEQLAIVSTLDEMLQETQRRGEPLLIAQLLRAAALGRLVTSGLGNEAEPLLDEMLAHSRRHGLALLQADAHALRGRRLVTAGQEDAALTEIARALAILDGISTPDLHLGRRAWDRLLSSALIDCWIVLNQLGVYESAEEVISRAHQAVRDSAGPHEITLQLINRVKMLLGWGLRLERVGREDEAGEKFRTAASMAVAVEAPFAESLFPRKPGVPAVEQVGVLAAALALATPGEVHIERLERLRRESGYPHENVLVTIALSRCLEESDRLREALEVLLFTRRSLAEDHSQPSMWLNLVRELARLSERQPDEISAFEPDVKAVVLIADYASALEQELWSLRESQVATLKTRREHERLSAEHGAMTQQALQDPLTGLPNRRALDERLRTLSSSSVAQPLAVALIDLDGFKDVNDRHSHADGDDVLRVIASTLRDVLRGDDIVARYGGDEFVALLPGAPLSAAEQALGRAVTAVASLPHHLSHGVTLSVGLVSLRPHERPEQVLSRADASMYEAKRGGGNQVAAGTPEGDETEAASEDPWKRP